jgi:uncharacterized protein YbjQ (UPF0145 family)
MTYINRIALYMATPPDPAIPFRPHRYWVAGTSVVGLEGEDQSDELFFRIIQVLILAAMFADGAAWLLTGSGFGVHQPGCLIGLVALEGVIRRFVRPDPRPLEMARALGQLRAQVRVFTQLPPDQVKQSLGLVRGLSDIEASSRRDFELAEQEALCAMLKEARALGANAVIDARLTTGTHETAGSQWQVARPVYTGTAVRI